MIYINDNLITDKITDYLPYKDIDKVRNKLIDGTFHIQTTAELPIKIIQITCNVTQSNKDTFEDAYIIDNPIRFEYEGKFYEGLLMDKPKYKSITILKDDSRMYEISFEFVASVEGVI